MNYAELKTAIADYLHRTDLTDKIPAWIALAEAVMLRELSVKDLDTFEIASTVGSYIDLPFDYGSLSRITVDVGGYERELDYLSAYSAIETDTPKFFTFENGQIRIWGAVTGQVCKVYYKAVIVPLSDSNASNWILVNAPDLYLYASCLEGAKYIRDMESVQALTAISGAALDSLRRYIDGRGLPSSGALRIKPRN